MKIRLDCKELKRVYRFCGGAMQKKTEKPAHRFIRLEAGEDGIIAYATDGVRAAKMRVNAGLAEGEGTVFLPVVEPPKGAVYCLVSDDGEKVHMDFEEGTTYSVEIDRDFPKPESLDKHFEGAGKAECSIYFNPELLAEALKAVKDGKRPVCLRFSRPIDPVFIEPLEAEGMLLVMPVRPPEGK